MTFLYRKAYVAGNSRIGTRPSQLPGVHRTDALTPWGDAVHINTMKTTIH